MALNPSRRTSEIGFAAALVAVAGAAYVAAGAYPAESASYPRALAVMLALAACVVIWREARGSGGEDRPPLFDHPGRFALGAAALIAYVGAIGLVGYLIPSFLLTVGLTFALGYRRPLVLVSAALGALGFIVLVFRVLLGRPLPPDVLDPLLRLLT